MVKRERVNYANGKIYSFRSPNMENYYIGSCASPLSKREYYHKYKANTECSSKIVVAAGGSYIELIEDYPCKSKRELERREGQYIRWNKEDVVNRNIAGRSRAEWYVDERVQILAKQKLYDDAHKLEKAIYDAARREKNKENTEARKIQRTAIREALKNEKIAYRQTHKVEIAAERKAHKNEMATYRVALAAAQAAAREGTAV